MPRGKQIPAEQIIAKLREAEVELARGKKVPEGAKKIASRSRRTIAGRRNTAACGSTRRSGSKSWRKRTPG